MKINELLIRAQKSARSLSLLQNDMIDQILTDVAQAIVDHKKEILSENKKDLARMDSSDPKYDRLMLTEARLESMAEEVKHIAALPSPVGKILSETTRPNGMVIRKTSVPFGVIGIIYEARPNVTIDVFSLCLKSGNVCVLKGGSDAEYSNRALVQLIKKVLADYPVDADCCTLLPPGREATAALLNATGIVDLIIPRGSSSLIGFVRENARIPVIETGAGICHTYFDINGDLTKGCDIILNAKTRRVSVCNALDCLIIHEERLSDLPVLCNPLKEKNVIIYADEAAFRFLSGSYPAELLKPATPESFGTEFLDYKMSIRTVASPDEAIEHIAQYSSRHSECIISESADNIRMFEQLVDASCVYANVSTAFTDGAQFGMGAEIGISTQKLHARGPMALHELTTYKYIVEGNGQIREN